jgi:hypothetical protein
MTRTRTSLQRTIVLVAIALAATGCGGERSAETTTPPRPTLPRTVAEDLAARSDAIGAALDAGDVCTAAVRADELQDATVTAINNGQVPQEFQEDLQARANELVNTVNCPAPPTTTEDKEGEDGEGKGRGKKKGKEKKGNDDEPTVTEDAPVVTVPTDTGVIP